MGKIIELKGRHIPEVGLGNEEPIYPVTSVHALYVDNNDKGMQWSEWWGDTLGAEALDSDSHSGGERGRIWTAMRSINTGMLKNANDIARIIAGDTEGLVDEAIATLGYIKTAGESYEAGTGISIDANVISALAASTTQYGVVRIGNGLEAVNGSLSVVLEQMQADWSNENPDSYGYVRHKPVIPARTSELINDSGFITGADGKVDMTMLGVANGVATLDDTGKVPSVQLPSYVDDVAEYASASGFPVPGEGGKIYVALNTNKTYRWGGTQYVEISASLALGETSSTAYRGDYGRVAYEHAQAKGMQFGLGLWKIITNAQGHVVEAVHPVLADFAEYGFVTHDTTYDVATQSANGLMSATDKMKLDGIMRIATSSDYNDILYNKPTIPTKTSELTNDSGFLTSHQSLADYVNVNMLGVAGGVAQLDLTGKVMAAQLPAIPTKISDLTNDSGFLTSHQDISGKVNKPSTNGTSGQVLATYGDGTTYWRDYSGGGGGGDTTDYADLTNKPQINSVTLAGNKSSSDLGLAAYNHTHAYSDLTGKPTIPGIVTSWRNSPTNSDVVSEALAKGLKDSLDLISADLNDFLGLAASKEDRSNKVTIISASSTDSQYPSAKLLFDMLALKVDAGLLGANSGVATLDSSGKVPSSQLPASTQEVAEYLTTSNFPATGVTGRIYIATSTGLMYRWDGTQYVSLASGLALGTTSSTAYRGDRGNMAYLHATDSGRLSTAAATGLYKIAATGEGHIASLTAVSKSDITALGIPSQDTTYEPADVDSGTDGLMTYQDKDKLDGIASGAEVNVQSDWNQSDNTKDDFIKNKPTINSVALSGNKTSSDLGLAAASHMHTMSQITDLLLDHSTIDTDSNGQLCVPIDGTTLVVANSKLSAVQVQADWNESNTSSPAYIDNKPAIPDAVSGVNDGTNWTSLTIGSVTKAIPSGGGGVSQVQSDWNQSNSSSVDYIKNKPAIPATSLVHDSSASINGSNIDFALGASGNSLTYLDVSSAAASSNLVLSFDASTFCGRHRLVLCNVSGTGTVAVTPANDNGDMMMANPSTTWNVYVKGQQQGSDYLVIDVMFDRITIGSNTANLITYEAKYFSEII